VKNLMESLLLLYIKANVQNAELSINVEWKMGKELAGAFPFQLPK